MDRPVLFGRKTDDHRMSYLQRCRLQPSVMEMG